MKEFFGIPIDLIVNSCFVAFRVEEGEEQEFKPTDFAKFINIAFCVIDEESGEEFYTEPITYSMN